MTMGSGGRQLSEMHGGRGDLSTLGQNFDFYSNFDVKFFKIFVLIAICLTAAGSGLVCALHSKVNLQSKNSN